MAQDYFGPGVSRTLNAIDRNFSAVVWQRGKPPLDAELNLMSQIEVERAQNVVKTIIPNGVLYDSSFQYITNKQWANMFALPPFWANLDGLLVHVKGTNDPVGEQNLIKLNPPPSGGTRVDFVFLEVWKALVGPNPFTANKPHEAELWKYGNVLYGGNDNPADDLEDPAIGFETTKRVQVQYRLRVFGHGNAAGGSVNLAAHPDGLDDPNILAQGSRSTPKPGATFSKVAPGLWQSTIVEGPDFKETVYAIPIAAIFRRNSQAYTLAASSGTPNHNGGFNRTPNSASYTDAGPLSTATLTADLLWNFAGGVVGVGGLFGSGWDNHVGPISAVINGEIVQLSNIDEPNGQVTISGRGRAPLTHAAGSVVEFYSTRPNGLFSDEIASEDILNLKREVNAGEWDYSRILNNAVAALIRGDLKSNWKRANMGDTIGPLVHEVSCMSANSVIPLHTAHVDGPDGVRTVWSDAATPQYDVTLLLDNEAPKIDNTVGSTVSTNDTFDATVTWEIGPDFHPIGFMNTGNVPQDADFFTNGSSIFLFIGGSDDKSGARGTFKDSPNPNAVRFIGPRESYRLPQDGNPHPVSIRWSGYQRFEEAPMVPRKDRNFESPFIVLGGLLHSSLRTTIAQSDLKNGAQGRLEIDVGIDLDSFSNPLVHGKFTLGEMLNKGGLDMTGAQSEVYVVLYGDHGATQNNGAFKVIGAGTKGYTIHNGTSPSHIVVQPLSVEWDQFTTFDIAGPRLITVEFRSQYFHSQDVSNFQSRIGNMAIVFTDVGNFDSWGATPCPQTSASNDGVDSKFILNLSLLYHPGHSGMARVPSRIENIALRGGGQADYLQNSFFDGDVTPFEFAHVQAWNRLSAKGWHAPHAPHYGGQVIGFTEITRESQVFVDKGSKSVIFRPYRNRALTMQPLKALPDHLLGDDHWADGGQKDPLNLWHNDKFAGIPIPREVMPRFGRQDIPYQTGTGDFLPGINHLFTSNVDATFPVFNIIGGLDNLTGGNQVTPLVFITQSNGTAYGHQGKTTINDVANQDFIGARRTGDVATNTPEGVRVAQALARVNSSDFGRGLKGIQIPPHYGIARILGVYELSDFNLHGGRSFSTDRRTIANNPATNLLKETASKQTLYILQGGGEDLDKNKDDHTYIVPIEALELNRINGFTGNWEDYNYVVVSEVFGFARGFINKNNYVLGRNHNGQGNVFDPDLELSGVGMTIPAPAAKNDQLLIAYERAVYQGRGNTSDFDSRYGVLSVTDQFNANKAIEQFDPNGDFVPETSNPYSVEVLASTDFYTTLGTGKIAGPMYASTMLDVGTLDGLRSPLEASETPPDVTLGAFTQGQEENPSRATASLIVHNNAELVEANTQLQVPYVNFVGNLRFGVPSDGSLLGSNVVLPDGSLIPLTSLNSFVVDSDSKVDDRIFTDIVNFGNPIDFTQTRSVSVNFNTGDSNWKRLDGVLTGAAVSVTAPPSFEKVIFDGYVLTPDEITLTARYLVQPEEEISYTYSGSATVAAHNSIGLDSGIPFPSAKTGMSFEVYPSLRPQQLSFSVTCTFDGSVDLEVYNNSNTPYTFPGSIDFRIRIVPEAADAIVDLSAVSLVVHVVQERGDAEVTARNISAKFPRTQVISNQVLFDAIIPGAAGNDLTLEVGYLNLDPNISDVLPNPHNAFRVMTGGVNQGVGAHFAGGTDLIVNAGDGTSSIRLTGLTERLPLGALLSDFDFLCENPLNDNASAMASLPSSLRPTQRALPLIEGGEEFSKFLSTPGEALALVDSYTATSGYVPYHSTLSPAGIRKFRLYRGSASAYLISGSYPGGPVDWNSGAVLGESAIVKGGILACKALLVSNEDSELELVILTMGHLKSTELSGVISPAGYGDGWAAADRFILPVRALVSSGKTAFDVNVPIAALYEED